MSTCSRRSILSALGVALPFGLGGRAEAAASPVPRLRFRPFEEALREAFAGLSPSPSSIGAAPGGPVSYRRIEVDAHWHKRIAP